MSIRTGHNPYKGVNAYLNSLLQGAAGAVYNTTCAQTPTYARIVDYSALPLSFERYTPEDQALLQACMATFAQISSAHQPE